MFGSSDNIAALKDLDEIQVNEGVGPGETRVLRTGIPSSRDNTPDHAQASDYNTILHEIQELRENKGQLEECLEILKSYHQRDYTVIVEALQEERYRYILTIVVC